MSTTVDLRLRAGRGISLAPSSDISCPHPQCSQMQQGRVSWHGRQLYGEDWLAGAVAKTRADEHTVSPPAPRPPACSSLAASVLSWALMLKSTCC